MKLLAPLFLLAAGPFWQEKPPKQWSDPELIALLTNSPWAQMVPAPAGADAPAAQIYLATAGPIDMAEHELARRSKLKHPRVGGSSDPLSGTALGEEYRAWLEEHRATQIVVAIGVRDTSAFADEQEMRRMEQESVMHAGRKKFKITGHFPPTESDPHLRLAFPRAVTMADKTVTFDLYVPGISMGLRSVEFSTKDLLMNGKLEM